MRVVIVGAGVVGITTGFLLQRAGHEVVVVEAQDVGAGASFANGAQLSYSYVAPLAGPAVFAALPEILFAPQSPLRFRPRLDPAQWRWGCAFLRACTAARSEATTRRLLELAAVSRAQLQELLATVQLEFKHRATGKLVIYRSTNAFRAACAAVERFASHAPVQQVLCADECVAVEPFLARQRKEIAGGIFAPSDETADCYEFCRGLARHVRVIGGTRIDRVEMEQGRAVAVSGTNSRIAGDAFVIANGVGARRLAATAGIALPIQALKGYSLTVRAPVPGPAVSVTDVEYRAVFAPLGDSLRIAGIADLGDDSTTLVPPRLRVLEIAAQKFLGAELPRDSAPWAGMRPATPDGLPIVGPARVPGLFVNTGHGGLGFTLAMASARLLVDLLQRN